MAWGLSAIWMIVPILATVGAADASSRPKPDPNLTPADLTVVVVLAMEAHLGQVCGRPFDRDRWFERVMADRVARGAPAAEIRALRKFWPRYLEAYDSTVESKGVNVCSAEVSEGFDNALARLRREYPE